MHNYQRLQEIRKQNKKTQNDIATLLNTTYPNYSRYERGERELPMHHFVTLARYYNVSLDYLAGLIDEPRELYPAPSSAGSGKTVSISNRGNNNKFNIKQ